MGRYLHVLSWSALCLLAAACATSSTPVVVDCPALGMRAMPRTEERQTFDASGFSVEFPRGDHWCIARSDDAGLMLAKNPFGGRTLDRMPSLAEQTHTFAAMATTITLQGATASGVEDFHAFLERAQQAGWPQSGEWGNAVLMDRRPPASPPSRITLASETLDRAKIQGVDCVLSRRTWEERNNPNPSLSGRVLILREHSWYCLNPGAPRVVWISYSERYLQGSAPQPPLIEALQPELEPFVQSLQVMP